MTTRIRVSDEVLLLLFYICIFLFTYLSCYSFFTSIHSLYLVVNVFTFYQLRTLLVLILISGDDLNRL